MGFIFLAALWCHTYNMERERGVAAANSTVTSLVFMTKAPKLAKAQKRVSRCPWQRWVVGGGGVARVAGELRLHEFPVRYPLSLSLSPQPPPPEKHHCQCAPHFFPGARSPQLYTREFFTNALLPPRDESIFFLFFFLLLFFRSVCVFFFLFIYICIRRRAQLLPGETLANGGESVNCRQKTCVCSGIFTHGKELRRRQLCCVARVWRMIEPFPQKISLPISCVRVYMFMLLFYFHFFFLHLRIWLLFYENFCL